MPGQASMRKSPIGGLIGAGVVRKTAPCTVRGLTLTPSGNCRKSAQVRAGAGERKPTVRNRPAAPRRPPAGRNGGPGRDPPRPARPGGTLGEEQRPRARKRAERSCEPRRSGRSGPQRKSQKGTEAARPGGLELTAEKVEAVPRKAQLRIRPPAQMDPVRQHRLAVLRLVVPNAQSQQPQGLGIEAQGPPRNEAARPSQRSIASSRARGAPEAPT